MVILKYHAVEHAVFSYLSSWLLSVLGDFLVFVITDYWCNGVVVTHYTLW
jgi:hypothetical protein